MVRIGQYSFPDDRKYLINASPNHFWAKKDKGVVILGISSFLKVRIGEVVSLALPTRSGVGKFVNKGQFMAPLKAREFWKLLYHQLSGEICDINENRVEDMNRSPYGEGWIIKFKLNDSIEQQLHSENWITSENPKLKEFIKYEDSHLIFNPV